MKNIVKEYYDNDCTFANDEHKGKFGTITNKEVIEAGTNHGIRGLLYLHVRLVRWTIETETEIIIIDQEYNQYRKYNQYAKVGQRVMISITQINDDWSAYDFQNQFK